MSDQRWLDGTPDPVGAELRQLLDAGQARTVDDMAVRRVWTKLGAATSSAAAIEVRLRPPPRWRWFVGGVVSSAALAAVLALVFWPSSHPLSLPTIHVSPSAQVPPAAPRLARVAESPSAVNRSAAGTLPVVHNMTGPASVRTASGETLSLSLPGGVAAVAGPDSLLTLEADQRPVVEAGDVQFAVPHQPAGTNFVVIVGPYRVVVVGTKFRVHSGDHVSVAVDEGVVEVWRQATRLARLAVGESWASPTTPAPPPAVATRARTRRRPTVVALSTPAPGIAALPRQSATTEVSESSAEDAFAAGDIRRGLELYGEILAKGGPAAENAAYEIGKVLRDRLHQPEAAVAAWRRYRGANPTGLLRVEADVSIIETLVRLGDSAGALTEATQFLRDHPESERRDEIARIAGDLQRAAGDCGAALRSYQLVRSRSRRSETIDRAAFGRVACLQTVGDGAAVEAVRQYLSDFPQGLFRDDAARLLEQKTTR
ncbi:MAG TPA: FecR family protein [Polyangia bacterium]|nr:FecR family protein [Polyangia bacterium]